MASILKIGSIAILMMVTLQSPVFASHILFEDNFSDNNANGWLETIGTQGSWQVLNGEYTGSVRFQGASSSPSISSVDLGSSPPWADFEVEFDIKNDVGVDKFFMFRYTSLQQTYVINVVSDFGNPAADDRIVLSKNTTNPTPTGVVLKTVNFPNNTGIWYKLRLNLQGPNIKLYVNNSTTPVLEYVDSSNPISSGGFAIVAWPGAYAGLNSLTKVHFDNVKVTNLDPDVVHLDVPFFSQNAEPWQGETYDHLTPLTMNQKGCWVTSAAMVLNYYDIDSIADPTNNNVLVPLTPGSLNNWLKSQNDGYYPGGQTNGYAISRWTRLRSEQLPSSTAPKLEFSSHNFAPTSSHALLNQTLTDSQPNIVRVNLGAGTHFMAATGKTDSTYLINDPEDLATQLDDADYGNVFSGIRQFVPSNTDLSALVLFSEPDAHLLLTDSQGRRAGKDPLTGEIYTEIPGSSYGYEPPIVEASNPVVDTQGINLLDIAKPPTDGYVLKVFADQVGEYEVGQWSYDQEANPQLQELKGLLEASQSATFEFQYDQDTGDSQTEKVVTFDSVMATLRSARGQGLIALNAANVWIGRIRNAQALYNRGFKERSVAVIEQVEKSIAERTPQSIKEETSALVREELRLLRESL